MREGMRVEKGGWLGWWDWRPRENLRDIVSHLTIICILADTLKCQKKMQRSTEKPKAWLRQNKGRPWLGQGQQQSAFELKVQTPLRVTVRMGTCWNKKPLTSCCLRFPWLSIQPKSLCTWNQSKLEMLRKRCHWSRWQLRSQRRLSSSACNNQWSGRPGMGGR